MAVEPIRDLDQLEEMKSYLMRKNYRDYALFFVGLNSGLRISDILKLRVIDVRNKIHLNVKETKTGKIRKTLINSTLRLFFDSYIKGMLDNEFLFQSQKGENRPITRQRAYEILNEAARKVGIQDIGTHTMRKTFGYHYYQKTKDVAMLQELFNHSAPIITLRYIGINQDLKDRAMEDFSL